MADKTGIEWTDATWNPLVGCTKVSPGCDNCYAVGVVNRWNAAGKQAFPNRFDVVTMRDDTMLTQPLRWRRPRRIFVNSLSDLFHTDVPDEFITRVFAVMALSPQHTFQLLTKRHARMRALLSSSDFVDRVWWEAGKLALVRNAKGSLAARPGLDSRHIGTWPLPHVWLGVSVEDQQWADIRIPALLNTPAAVRWISAEPLLGPVNLLCGGPDVCAQNGLCGGGYLQGLDWVVVGGESGAGARPMHPRWARDLRDQCAAAGVPFLFKQWGEWLPLNDRPGAVEVEYVRVGKKAAGRELDGRTHDGYPAVAR